MKKGFTLIEVVVAIGLLVMMLTFSSVIFKVGIGSHRTAGANAEIMGKLRAITDQLNTDFKGLRKDAPLLIWFQKDTPPYPYDPNRYDQIMFFADGDFQSIQLYSIETGLGTRFPALTGTPVRGNAARIYYGQARSLDSRDNVIRNPFDLLEEDRILARRQHILTADPYLAVWPGAGMMTFDDFDDVDTGGEYINEGYEHDSLSLAEWKIAGQAAYSNTILNTCFGVPAPIYMDDPNTFHKLMCEGIGSFAVQWAYRYSAAGPIDEYRWFPSDDPDGNTDPADSDFDEMMTVRGLPNPEFGIYFNIPGGVGPALYWYGPGEAVNGYIGSFSSNFYPDALKFTFTIYDSRGIIEDGRTFTHIVYLGN